MSRVFKRARKIGIGRRGRTVRSRSISLSTLPFPIVIFAPRITIISPQSTLTKFHSSNQTEGYGDRITPDPPFSTEVVGVGDGGAGHPGSIELVDPATSSNQTAGYGDRLTPDPPSTIEVVGVGEGGAGHPGNIELSTTYA